MSYYQTLRTQMRLKSLKYFHKNKSSHFYFPDKCVMHHVVNGNISQISDDNHPTKVWKVQCNPGFELFGQDRIKCRGGVMTAKFPVCASKCSY